MKKSDVAVVKKPYITYYVCHSEEDIKYYDRELDLVFIDNGRGDRCESISLYTGEKVPIVVATGNWYDLLGDKKNGFDRENIDKKRYNVLN